jgi:hypothetical protein
MIRKVARLLRAIDEGPAHGLTVAQVAEVLEGTRRTAYRWIEALTGDPDLPYDYIDARQPGGGRVFREKKLKITHDQRERAFDLARRGARKL